MSYNEISFRLLENVLAPPGHVAAVCSDLEFSPFFRSASLPFSIKKYFSSWAFHLLKYAIYNFLRDYDRNSTYYSFKVLEFKLVKPSIEFQFLIFYFWKAFSIRNRILIRKSIIIPQSCPQTPLDRVLSFLIHIVTAYMTHFLWNFSVYCRLLSHFGDLSQN